MNAFKKIGILYVLATPILAGLSTFEFKADDGFTITGLIWVLQFAAGLVLLPFVWSNDDHRGDLRPWWPWLIWCGVAVLSLFRCEELGRRNIQETAQLCMPVLVGMIASSVMRSRGDLKKLLTTFNITFVFMVLFTIAFVSERFDEEWINTRVRPAALTITFIGCIYFAYYPRRGLMALSGWAMCVLLTLLTQSRMATATLLGAPIIYPLYRRRWLNFAAAGVLAVIGLGLFYTPIVQKRFFEGGSGGLSEAFSADYSGAGRFEAWPAIWDEAWQHPLLGAGVGSAYEFVPRVWEDIYHCHNDYLRVFFEMGLVGEVAFLFAIGWQLVLLYRCARTSRGLTQMAFAISWMGYIAMVVSSMTDNTIIYNIYFTNPLFAVIGAAYGVLAASTEGNVVAERTTANNLRKLHYQTT